MRITGLFSRRTSSQGRRILCAGVVALFAAAAVFLCALASSDLVYQPLQELPGKWIDGHFQTEPFWITWRMSGYAVGLEVPDTRVATADLDRSKFVQRCGQPFPNGVVWSVLHFGRVIAHHTSFTGPWCRDVSVGHGLRAEIGTFRAWPGPGYAIRIDAPGWAPADSAFRLPLRLTIGAEPGVRPGPGVPVTALLYLLVWSGIMCVALGAALLIMERLRISERLEEHLERRRQSPP